MDDLSTLAALIKAKNAHDLEIARILHRPAQLGHAGEYIASRIFNIELNVSAAYKGDDGAFRNGPLRGCRVNIKWYGRHEGLLDMSINAAADLYYLVMIGPKGAAVTSVWASRPWVIDFVFLFKAQELIAALRARKIPPKIGVATSVAKDFWHAAEIYPSPTNPLLPLNEQQQAALRLFGSDDRTP